MRTFEKLTGATLLAALMWAQPNPAKLQIIHAVADLVGVSFPLVADSVDLYAGVVNSPGDTSWIPAAMNFKFRQATPYFSVPPNKPLVAKVLPGDQPDNQHNPPTSTFTQAPAAVIRSGLDPGTAYVAIVHGQLSPLAPPPFYGLEIDFFDNARQTATGPNASNEFQFIVHHSANDVGTVDIYLAYDRTTSAYQPDLTLAQYAYSSGYIGLNLDNLVVLDPTPADKNDILPIGFYVPNPNPNLLGQTGVVFASGYVNPDNPRKAFGLHVALANGTVIALPTRTVRRLQIVHNAADTSLAQVDIHPGGVGNGDPISLDFRQATPTFFVDAPTGASVTTIDITKRGQTSPVLATVNLTIPAAGQNHIVFAQGVVNPAQYASNPNSVSTAFTLRPITNIKGWTSSTSFIAVPFHGVTDAPAVDLYAGGTPIATNIKYLDHASEVTLPAGTSANIEVRPAGNSTPVATFQLASTQSQGGVGTVIFASGFLNPSANRNGPAFGLFIVYPDGTVQSLSMVSGVNAAMPYQISGIAGNPSATGEWTLYLGAATQGEVPYTLTTLAGQVLQQGTYTLPGAGTWAYKINGENLPTGVYLLRLGAEMIRLVRL